MTTTTISRGTYGLASGGGWWRDDLLIIGGVVAPVQQRLRCDGLCDDSPRYVGDLDGARCPCCYLGHAHTEALHERYVRQAGE